MAASSEIDELSLYRYEDEVLMELDLLSDDEVSSVVPALPPRAPTLAMSEAGAPPPAVTPFPTARIDTTPPTLPSLPKKTRRPRLSREASRYLKGRSDTKMLRLVLLDDSHLQTNLRTVLFKYLKRDDVKTIQFLDEYWNSILRHLEKYCIGRLQFVRRHHKQCVSEIKKHLKQISEKTTSMYEEFDSNPTTVINTTASIEAHTTRITTLRRNHDFYQKNEHMYAQILEDLGKHMSLTDVRFILNGKTANEWLNQTGVAHRFSTEFEDPAKKSMDDRKHFTIIDGGSFKDGMIGDARNTQFWRNIGSCQFNTKTFHVRYLTSLLCDFVEMLCRSFGADTMLARIVTAIDRELARTVRPPPPPFNGVKTILHDVEKDDMDPITLEPFESGSEVFVMSCCRNKLCKESVQGILNSGRTPKCPLCRTSMFTAEWDRDMSWFA